VRQHQLENKQTQFQINLITDLEIELKSTFEMYLIITIYKAEALDANNQSKESAELISKVLLNILILFR
jgi:hypothetical protein